MLEIECNCLYKYKANNFLKRIKIDILGMLFFLFIIMLVKIDYVLFKVRLKEIYIFFLELYLYVKFMFFVILM